MGEFRTVEQIKALADLRPQEKELLEKAEAGEGLTLGDGKLPSAGDYSRSIRAGIIRYLLLGGCEGLRCHEKGVQIMGAWVPDLLDLQGCDSNNMLYIKKSRFSAPLKLQGAKLRAVFLNGSHCPKINADRLHLKENLHLKDGFLATGEVRLLGAKIGGNLDCEKGIFSNQGSFALSADRVVVGGNVFLRGKFNATGAVRILGAVIGGNLECDDGTFNNVGGYALNASNAKISGSLIWRSGARAVGRVELSGASCASLIDDWDDWPQVHDSLSLNGFTYGSIDGNGAVDAETRLKWLALDDVSRGFRPQPYQHLAKVLREMGHAEDARKVMVEKERLQRTNRLARLKKRLEDLQPTDRMPDDQYAFQTIRVNRHQLKFDLWWLPKWDRLFRRLVGYGYYPFNSFWFGLGLFLFAAALFSLTWNTGAFAPNSPVILISDEWASVLSEDNPAKAWEDGPGRDYETYHSLAYAFDTVIPLIDLGQESAWSPSTSRGPFGWFAWWMKWLLKVAGWIITALGAAALTGIIRRD